jgi:hypothetical protein
MADGDGLAGGPRRVHCSRSFHVVRADSTGKATADLVRRDRPRTDADLPICVLVRRHGIGQ